MTPHLVTLPATWASALVNNEWTGLEHHYPEDAKEAREWLAANPELQVLSMGDSYGIARFNGELRDMASYVVCEVTP